MPVFACAGVDGAFGAARDAGSLHSLPEAVVEAQRCGTDDGGGSACAPLVLGGVDGTGSRPSMWMGELCGYLL